MRVLFVEDKTLNSVAPSVYIESVEIVDNFAKVFYSLEDSEGKWINKQNILESLAVTISLSSSDGSGSIVQQKSSLLDLSNFRQGNYIKSDFSFPISNLNNFSLTASCGNANIIGPQTFEQIKLNGEFVNASFNNVEFNNLSKVIDLNLLKTDFSVKIPKNRAIATNELLTSQPLISYRIDKKANVGFIINLEKYLTNNSPFYNLFKNYNDFKKTILSNSRIEENFTVVYKKNVTKLEKDYYKIYSTPTVYKLSDSTNEFLVTITDDNENLAEQSSYALKLDLAVYDFSYDLFENEIKNKLKTSIKFLEEYVDLFNQLSKQKTIKNINTYIFENIYDTLKTKIVLTVDNLSQIFAFVTSQEKTKFIKLLLSCFHPLITNSNILNAVLQSVLSLQNFLNPLINELNYAGDSSSIIEKTLAITKKTYVFSDFDSIDYNYTAYNGYEVFSNDPMDIRENEPQIGFRLLTLPEDKKVKATLEARKYLSAPTLNDISSVAHYSISSIDLSGKTYFLNSINPQTGFFDELFIKLNEFNNHNFSYRRTESAYAQLNDSGICINTITNAINNSKNNLFVSVIFDPNIGSQQQSLEFITSTGVEKLLVVSKETGKVNEVKENLPPESIQFKSAFSSSVNNLSNFSLTGSTANSVDATSKIVLYYQSVFYEKKIFEQQNNNYSVYSYEPTKAVNELFKNKLRLMNKYFIVFNKKPAREGLFSQKVDYLLELNSNIESKYLNRVVGMPKVINGVNTL